MPSHSLLRERFFAKVDTHGPKMQHMRSRCHVWTAGQVGKLAKVGRGYGGMRVGQKIKPAHIVAWFLAEGEWPPAGQQVRHACDNTLCVRRLHLSLGTNQDNADDRTLRRNWPNQKKTKCPAQHDYDEENTYLRPDGARGCRKCMRRANQKWRERRRAAA